MGRNRNSKTEIWKSCAKFSVIRVYDYDNGYSLGDQLPRVLLAPYTVVLTPSSKLPDIALHMHARTGESLYDMVCSSPYTKASALETMIAKILKSGVIGMRFKKRITCSQWWPPVSRNTARSVGSEWHHLAANLACSVMQRHAKKNRGTSRVLAVCRLKNPRGDVRMWQ